MKKYVYVLTWFDAEPYSDYGGLYMIFDSMEKAKKHLEEIGPGPHGVDEDNHDHGYYVRSQIQEYEVN